jgi:hypothetical protein
MASYPLPPHIILPELPGLYDIRGLSFLAARFEKNNHGVSIPGAVYPMTCSGMESELVNTASEILRIAPKPSTNPLQTRIDNREIIIA